MGVYRIVDTNKLCALDFRSLFSWEIDFIHSSHDGVTLDVDRDVSTAILLVFVGR